MQDIDNDTLARRAQRVLRRICDNEILIATAESCTGGAMAALVTDIEGCSHAFDRGFVTYTDAAKRQMLGVPEQMLETHGAVSEPVARAMAEGALARSDAAIALAVTGFAGPTLTEGEEGQVHFAVASQLGPAPATSHLYRAFGPLGRDRIRALCLETLIEMLEDATP